jgi:hypothetical protein
MSALEHFQVVAWWCLRQAPVKAVLITMLVVGAVGYQCGYELGRAPQDGVIFRVRETVRPHIVPPFHTRPDAWVRAVYQPKEW